MPDDPSKNPPAAGPSPHEEAWRLFSLFDGNASRAQKAHRRLRTWILALGVAATTLAIIYEHLRPGAAWPRFDEPIAALWLLVVLAPIATGVLVAGAARFGSGESWVELRSTAESVKREIYRFRTRVGPYREAAAAARGTQAPPPAVEQVFAERIKDLTRMLLDAESVHKGLRHGSLEPPWLPGGDDGRSDLDGEGYLKFRLLDQIDFYRRRVDQFEARFRRTTWWILALGGAGTLLAAVAQEIWVPVSVSLAAALGGYLEIQGLEQRIAAYTRAALELDLVQLWWRSQPEAFRASDDGRQELVERTEVILEAESGGWRRQMEATLEALRGRGESAEPAAGARPGGARA